MSSTGHFSRMSKELLRFLENHFLHDLIIITDDGSVSLHSIMFIVFSSHFRENLPDKTDEILLKGFKKAEVGQLVRFLYNGDETVLGNSLELVKALKLDLVVDQRIRKKKTSKSHPVQSIIEAELKYLRNLTFEMMIPKLLDSLCFGTDLTVRTGKDVHKCHRILVCANSLYFELMFSSGMKESTGETIHLQGIETDIFKIILTYMYSGNISLTTTNAQDLLSTAIYLQIHKLQIICEEFLLQQLDSDNCLDMWSLASTYNCKKLSAGAWTYIVDNFCLIPKHKFFNSMKVDALCKLLADDSLNVSSENDVFKLITDWIKNNQSVTSNELDLLFDCCRFSLVDEKFLEELLKQDMFDKDTKAIIKEVIKKQKQLKEEVVPRREKTFLVIKRSSYTTGIEAACFSLSKRLWYSLKSNPQCEGGTGFVCCTVQDSIVVSGGTATPKHVTQYLVNENTWKTLAEMNEGRSSHAIGYIDGKLYVLGGSDVSAGAFNILSTIEKHDFKANTWAVISKMEIPTYDSAFAVVKSRIYILGGSMGMLSGVYIKDIQCFDTVTETCTKMYHNLPVTLSLADACVNSKDIYITCPNGSVIHYNEDRAPTKINQTNGSQLMGFSTLYHDSAVYIMGGYSVHGESDSIQRFDLKTNKEDKLTTKLPFKKQTNQLFAAVMYVSRRFLTQEYPTANEKPKSKLRNLLFPH